MGAKTMTVQRAVKNAVVSTEMEGFKISDEQLKLINKIMKKEITLEEALKQLNQKYDK